MKKMISWVLLIALCVSLLAGCQGNPTETTAPNETTAPQETLDPAAQGLADAVAYIRTVYKNAAELTGKDFDRIGRVPMGTDIYTVTWTASVGEDLVKFVVAENGKVTVDVNEDCDADTPYTLTAVVTAPDGTASEPLTWNHILPAGADVDGLTYAQIVDMGYALADGTALEDTYRLFGTITAIDSPWSDEYKNITVIIQVGNLTDKPIMCYRLSGEGAETLAVGDQITVEGIIKNYKGTIEFDKGCVLLGKQEVVDQTALVKAAYALADGGKLDYPAVMTGVITAIPSAWSDEYGNITVDMEVEGKLIEAYRLVGEGAKDLAIGDQITVVGIIKNYKGLIEFDKGCVLVPNNAYHSVKNALSAYKLADGAAQEVSKTITGTIATIDTAYSAEYKNITVTIVVAGLEDYKIQCYRLAGEGAETLAVGDTITVTGILKNYKGTYEFDKGCTLDAVVKAG